MTKIWKDGSGSDVSCGTGGSGNWGWLDCGGKGVTVLAAAIASGCSTPITLDTSTTPPSFTITGSPGNKGNAGPVKSAMNATLDQIVDLPVYSTFSGTGANATYTIIGFLSVQLCGYDTYHGLCYDNDPAKSSAGDALQVRYAAYTPVGELGNNCGVGQIYCSNNALVIKLVS